MSGTTRPEGLDERGASFWDAVTRDTAFDAAALALLEQACRCVDRLARLDALIAGDDPTWLALRQRAGGTPTALTVAVDGLLVEARQQQHTLRALLGAMNLGRAAPHRGGTAEPVAGASSTPTSEGALDDLARRRSTRRRRPVASD